MTKGNVRRPAELKKKVVELYYEGRSVVSLSEEYNVASITIYKWINHYVKQKEAQKLVVSLEEYQLLEKQYKDLEEENAVLRRAAAIFARLD